MECFLFYLSILLFVKRHHNRFVLPAKMLDVIRDAPVGQLLRLITSNAILLYPEERERFDIETAIAKFEKTGSTNNESSDGKVASADKGTGTEYCSVGWYSPDDPANPQNWPLGKKCAVHALICFLTFTSRSYTLTLKLEEL